MDTGRNLSDEELVHRLKSGQYRYFSILADRYEEHIYTRCLSYVKDSEAAKDLRQEILIKVFLQLSGFREEASFKTWLYTIIHHTCIDFLRKNRKQLRSMYVERLSNALNEMSDAEEDLSPELNEQILNQLLDELSPEDKLILLLKYKEKHPISDIMKTMDLSESAVKMRLKRARERVNALFRKLKDVDL